MGPLFLIPDSAILYPRKIFSSHFPGGVGMRDFFQVLREKELEVIRVREEIEALRSIIPLLEEEGDAAPPDSTIYSIRAVNHD
jgi:hypothetical protein